MNLSKMEFVLLKHLNLQPSEMDRMEFYRLEYLIENFREWNEEEKKRQDAEEKKYKNESGSMTSFKKDFDSMKNNSGFPAAKMPNFKF